VIDTDEGIQQSVIRDNPDILRQLIDERIAEMKRKGDFQIFFIADDPRHNLKLHLKLKIFHCSDVKLLVSYEVFLEILIMACGDRLT